MQYRITCADVTRYPGDRNSVYDFVRSLSPDNMPIIDGLADAATNVMEKYLGSPIGKRQIKLNVARGETELNDAFARSWLSGGFSYGGCISNQWIELPTPAESVQNINLGVWGDCQGIDLVDGQDFYLDLTNRFPRIMLSYNIIWQDFFIKYKNLTIDYVGGIYEVDGTIPSPIDTGIKFLVNGMFNNSGDSASILESNGFKFLVDNYRKPSIVGSRL